MILDSVECDSLRCESASSSEASQSKNEIYYQEEILANSKVLAHQEVSILEVANEFKLEMIPTQRKESFASDTTNIVKVNKNLLGSA